VGVADRGAQVPCFIDERAPADIVADGRLLRRRPGDDLPDQAEAVAIADLPPQSVQQDGVVDARKELANVAGQRPAARAGEPLKAIDGAGIVRFDEERLHVEQRLHHALADRVVMRARKAGDAFRRPDGQVVRPRECRRFVRHRPSRLVRSRIHHS
jgi:hypothetical protein